MAYCRNCGSRINDNAKYCASCGQVVPKTQQPSQPQQPTYRQPQYAPPAPAKKKSSAPLLVGGIAGLCVIAIIVVVTYTNFFSLSNENGVSDSPSQTTRPISPETPAGKTDGNGHQGASVPGPDINGTVSEWPDIIPLYNERDMIIDVSGGVTGITALQTGEQRFIEYIIELIDSGWECEEVPGTEIMVFARKDDFMVSLFYTDGAAAIMLCRVID